MVKVKISSMNMQICMVHSKAINWSKQFRIEKQYFGRENIGGNSRTKPNFTGQYRQYQVYLDYL